MWLIEQNFIFRTGEISITWRYFNLGVGGGGGGGGGVSRDFDSNSGISDNLSRDWTSQGWQVCIVIYTFLISTSLCLRAFLLGMQ